MPGTIYLAPGGKHMTVVKRNNQPAISLNDGPLVNFCRPAVDPLFASAAQVWGSAILAVVLTGMGSDGARGAEDIVAAGGSVIAQDEATSVVWGMPGAAAHAGVCAAVLPLDQIGPKIVRLFGGDSRDATRLRLPAQAAEGPLRPRALGRQAVPGREPADRRSPARPGSRRSASWWRSCGASDERLIVDVVEAMTTNESFFFRDKIPFDHFRDTIMPGLLAARARERRLRIWCAAASTGQEPYSLAMCLKEMKDKLAGWRVEILGTDLSTEVLEKAKAGIYSQFEVQRGLPIQMLVKYFSQVGDTWQISPEIRAMVQYRPLNLLADFAHLGGFDVVFCRNVLIYFDQETKIGVLNRIARLLDAGRLPGARRGRDRRGPDRRVQAARRQARPVRAEQGCREAVVRGRAAGAAAGRDCGLGRYSARRLPVSHRPSRRPFPPERECGNGSLQASVSRSNATPSSGSAFFQRTTGKMTRVPSRVSQPL